MISNTKLKSIVRAIVEEKKPPVGAAAAEKRRAETTKRVRAEITRDMENVAPGATNKGHLSAVRKFEETRKHIEGIINHPATTPELKDRLIKARALSSIDRVLRDLVDPKE